MFPALIHVWMGTLRETLRGGHVNPRLLRPPAESLQALASLSIDFILEQERCLPVNWERHF